MSETPRIVCILGMHRSGSSLAAQVLRGNGFRTGRSQVRRSRFNPEGHLEDRYVVRTNKKLLLRFGGAWDRPPQLPRGWLDDRHVEDLSRQARRYRDRELGGERPYFFKDPRSSLLIPFWHGVFGGPALRYLVVLRSPAAVVESLVRRQQDWLRPGRLGWRLARTAYHSLQGVVEPLRPLGRGAAETLWHLYYERIVRDLAGLGSPPPSILIYEQLLAEPNAEIRRTLSELGAPATTVDAAMVKPALSHAGAARIAPEVAHIARLLLSSAAGS